MKKERNKGERADWFWKKQKNRIAYSTSSTSECAGKLPVDWRQCVTALWQLFVSGRFRANWCKRHSQGLLCESTCSWGVGSTPQTLLGLHSNLFHVGMQTRSTISEPDGVCMCSCQSCLKKRKSPFPIRVKYSCCLWNVGFIIHVYLFFFVLNSSRVCTAVQTYFSPLLLILKLQYMGSNWLLSNYTPHST